MIWGMWKPEPTHIEVAADLVRPCCDDPAHAAHTHIDDTRQKVASEIFRLRGRIAHMEAELRGLDRHLETFQRAEEKFFGEVAVARRALAAALKTEP